MSLTNATGTLPSPLPDLSGVPLDQVPALAVAVLERRTPAGPPAASFNSSI